jgi:D-alanine-D-alanine ligase
VTVGVVFGGPSPEHDISILSGLQVARILSEAGDSVVCLYWSKAGNWRKVPVGSEAPAFLEPEVEGSVEVELRVPGGFSESRKLRASIPIELETVVNCCHGGAGEDGGLSAMLRLAGYNVTGPSPEAASLSMDKFATAALAEFLGIPTIPTQLLSQDVTLPTPWVVKPRFGGSSLGVEVGVMDLETARSLGLHGVARAGSVVQPYLQGWQDLNIAVRTYPDLQVSPIERPLRDADSILDYKTKYLRGAGGMESTPRELPADLPADLANDLERYAVTIVTAMGLTGLPRVDFLWDGSKEVRLCEVNAIPGALGLYLWEAKGARRVDVLRDWIQEGRTSRPMRPQWSPSSDGAALRSANSIAAKLMR